jgi:hypothetical protein
MIGFSIFISHLLGDYVLQNNWMANEKTKRWWPALVHGFVYSLPYAVLLLIIHQPTWGSLVLPWSIIFLTHVVIDHFRVVKYWIWGVNQLAPRAARYPWAEGKANGGYSAETPVWLATWLMIFVDNTTHLIINALAIYLT